MITPPKAASETTKATLEEVVSTVFGKGADVVLAGPVWFAWRDGGRLLRAGWLKAPTLAEAITRARESGGSDDATVLELCLTEDYRPVPASALEQAFSNAARGRVGIEIQLGTALHRIPPTLTIASNRKLLREVEVFATTLGLSLEEVRAKARFARFGARQFLVDLRSGADSAELYRGNQVIAPDAVGPDLLQGVIDGMIGWMLSNVRASGRMTYKYWPSRGAYSSADNTIRQFMASVALGRIAQRLGTPAARDAFQRNLQYNLKSYYTEVDGLGGILLDGKIKLGANALAALAILEGRQCRLLQPDSYKREFDGLCRSIDHLWQPDGSWRTFLLPGDRNDNQNFYPGEALLFWATLYRRTRDPGLAAKCLKSFEYYSAWHLAQPNPAFVPWHSQAYVMLYEDIGEPALADFVFSRNDWLLEMQQWGGTLDPDLWGRFFHPKRSDFGPPHASSTGVYMEGLADAWRLAVRLGDVLRADRYAKTLRRGLRSVAQLQFRNENDMYYISRPERVRGGLRTEVYNNEIRVDNVQHCLMALLKFDTDPLFPWPVPAVH
ncbi:MULTISPECIES: hypothetical protein [Thioclava]|uniref:Uncharacterized protein n=1 Tax=Thioclava electrotropha TaxID=1549850 RepID=A0ABX6YZZ5_9RHOB|nr:MULTISPECIES: hypothetical protein [Thioclava]MPQ95997.1 hypothetical protein [Thioclava sp. JE_KL1]QPZ93350.1 hypothetical protein AKL02_020430 [Thioclava electrotropha]